jgi:hypothetical protein
MSDGTISHEDVSTSFDAAGDVFSIALSKPWTEGNHWLSATNDDLATSLTTSNCHNQINITADDLLFAMTRRQQHNNIYPMGFWPFLTSTCRRGPQREAQQLLLPRRVGSTRPSSEEVSIPFTSVRYKPRSERRSGSRQKNKTDKNRSKPKP